MDRQYDGDGKPIPTADEQQRFLALVTPQIAACTEDMLEKCRRRAHYVNGRQHMTAQDAIAKLREELVELEEALASGSAQEIQFEAADVANMAVAVHALATNWVALRTSLSSSPA